MKVSLAFGTSGLYIVVPDGASIVAPVSMPGMEDEVAAIRRALREPIASSALRHFLGPDPTVAVVFSDLTRPVPNRRLLPPILTDIEDSGVPRSSVTLINACGMHRPNTPAELDAMLGPEVIANYCGDLAREHRPRELMCRGGLRNHRGGKGGLPGERMLLGEVASLP